MLPSANRSVITSPTMAIWVSHTLFAVDCVPRVTSRLWASITDRYTVSTAITT